MNDCCRACGRRIPHTRLFCMIDTVSVRPVHTGAERWVAVCTRCMQNSGHLHAMLIPDCREHWHDLYDHATVCQWKRVGA
jgi:hypothetical protein